MDGYRNFVELIKTGFDSTRTMEALEIVLNGIPWEERAKQKGVQQKKERLTYLLLTRYSRETFSSIVV